MQVARKINCSLVAKALDYKPKGRGFQTRWSEILNLRNPSGPLGPGVYSASNRNEYWKHKKKSFWGVKCGWCVGADNLTAIYEPIV
jgi:hypothetical protein